MDAPDLLATGRPQGDLEGHFLQEGDLPVQAIGCPIGHLVYLKLGAASGGIWTSVVDHVVFMVTSNNQPTIPSLSFQDDLQAFPWARTAIDDIAGYDHRIRAPLVDMGDDFLESRQVTMDVCQDRYFLYHVELSLRIDSSRTTLRRRSIIRGSLLFNNRGWARIGKKTETGWFFIGLKSDDFETRPSWRKRMKLAIGSDERTHLTDAVIEEVKRRGHEVVLFGPLAGKDHYWPEVAQKAAEMVSSGKADEGILFCWTGTGISLAANKVPGIRAALCGDAETARGARLWNKANILCLSLRATSEVVAQEILETWFATDYVPNEVDDTCLADVEAIEQKYFGVW